MQISKRLRTFLVFLALVLLTLVGIKYLFPVLTPFIIGLLIAYLIEPPVKWLEERIRLPHWLEKKGILSARPLAVTLVLVTTLIVGGIILTFSFARLYLEAKELLVDLPEKLVGLAREAERLFFQVQARLQLPEGFWEQPWLRPESLMETAGGFLQDFLQRLLNLFRGFPIFLINLFLSGLAAYFFSRDKEKLSAFLFSLLPQEWREPARRLQGAVVLSTLNFLKIQVMLATITGLVATFFLGLFGFARPGLVGVLTGILDLLPMVGPTTLFLPWAGWNFAVGDFFRGLLILGILLIILGMRQLSELRLLGKRLGLHPLSALFSVYLGFRLFGVYGLFAGPVVFVMLRSFYYGVLPLLEREGRS
ncbi:MAG: sporulation integral membrane protein YtvI [Clostridia bacterium]|nr:sporulation integral membrane protein YtvI [Clostridia bacterium]